MLELYIRVHADRLYIISYLDVVLSKALGRPANNDQKNI